MSPAEAPQDPIGQPATAERGGPRPSQRIASAAFARGVGEVVAKLASLVFFVAIARELGEEQFGEFIFGLSFSTVLMVLAGFGLEELIAREVAKDRREVDELLWNVVVLKALMVCFLLVVIAVTITIQGYSLDARLAILVISAGVGFDYETNALFAVFQGYERQQHVATSLIVNRISTAAFGIGVLVAGGGLVLVAIVFTLGSALGVGTAYALLRRYVVRFRHYVDVRAWWGLVRAGFPLGVLGFLGVISLRSSVVLLGFLGAGSVVVGQYGAAFRLIEATLFVPWSFSNAVLPWFSRHPGSGPISVARGLEMSLKAILAVMLPVALGLALFAGPVVETVYGPDYGGAAAPLRVLAAMALLVGINAVITAVLIGRDQPRVYTVPAAVAIVTTLVLSFVLIPAHGGIGAAVTAVASGAVLAVLSIAVTTHLVGSISTLRVVVAPLAAGASMALVAIALSGAPWVGAAVISTVVYGAAFLAIERILFPGDFAYYSNILPFRDARQGQT